MVAQFSHSVEDVMKKILSSQFNAVSGGWHDRDGYGHRSSDNNGSAAANHSGNDHSLSSFLSKNFPYGSGSGASGFWGNNQGTRNGYGGNGTGPRCAGLGLGGKNH